MYVHELALLALWIVLLGAAVPYTARHRHPRSSPLAAYLVFVGVFSLIAAAIYASLTVLALSLHLGAWLANPAVAVAFAALVFAPAFFAARAVLGRPPRRADARPPD